VKFVGLGEKYDALEAFYPERIVSRVLGMAIFFADRARRISFDKKAAMELERKLRKEEFTWKISRPIAADPQMGPLDQLMDICRSRAASESAQDASVDEKN